MAKLALEKAFLEGPALTFSAIGTTLLLSRFVLQPACAGKASADAHASYGCLGPGLAVTGLAVVVRCLFLVETVGLAADDALAVPKLRDGLWPILVAGGIAILAAAEPVSDLAAPARNDREDRSPMRRATSRAP